MKILLVKSSSGYVDVMTAPYNLQEIGLARAFNIQGYHCDVVYWGGRKEKVVDIEYASGKYFKVYYLKAFNFLKNGIYFGLIELSKKYDIVQCGGYDQMESWILAKKIPEKLVIYHGTYYSDFNVQYNKKCRIFDRFFLPRYLKNNICFDTKSNLSAEFLRKKRIENVTSVGVGIDLKQLQARELLQSDISQRLKELKESNKKIITYIGRIEPRRNIEFLLDVFKAVRDKEKDAILVLIGKGSEKYTKQCLEHIKVLGIAKSIIYKEYMKQEFLPAVYSFSDVFLLPTRYEIFGMVLLEAMYFHVPVVTTYNGGSDMLIEDNYSGIILSDFDITKWRDSVLKILEDKEYSQKLSDHAADKIKNKFTWDILVNSFIEIFEKKLSQNRGNIDEQQSV